MVLRNKKFLVFIPLAIACSSNSSVTNTTLVPMTSTDYVFENTVVIKEIPSELAYIDDLYYYYGSSPSMFDNETLIEFGHIWCDLMTQGMMADDIVSRINEGSSNQEEADLQVAIVNSAVINFCPNNQKIWSM
jgi:hypothetical protein